MYRIVMTILAAGLLMAGCGHKERQAEGESLPPVKVRLGEVEKRALTRAQWLPGTVHPAEKAVVSAKLMATVREADLIIGQHVEAGEILVVLGADEIDAQVEQARAALARVERNHEREKNLLAQNATTAETVRSLEDELRLARARLEEAVTMQGYKEIRAPFDGRITSKEIRRGDLARPGMPLLSIEGTDQLQVHVQVPDSLSALEYGSTIEVGADGRTLEARLTEWSPAADPASRTRLAKLDLPAGAPVRSGQYVRVNWPADQTTSLWLPEQALARFGQMERVFVVREGRLHLRLVRTGAARGQFLQVLSGLEEGEKVVLNPSSVMRDGQPAEIES